MSAAEDAAPISAAQAEALFRPLVHASALILAVSGGPDSTALMLLAARWRAALRKGPALLAVTVDHGLRREVRGRGARGRSNSRAGSACAHRTLRWRGKKPDDRHSRRPRARRAIGCSPRRPNAGERALHSHRAHARRPGRDRAVADDARQRTDRARRDDAGVAAAGVAETDEIMLVRPLLDIPKARLIATLDRAKVEFARDPSNRDPRFTRPRLRDLMPALAREGLDARRLAILARRLRRAEAAIEMAVGVAASAVLQRPWSGQGPDRLRCGEVRPPARRSGIAAAGAGDRAGRRRRAGRTRQARGAVRRHCAARRRAREPRACAAPWRVRW